MRNPDQVAFGQMGSAFVSGTGSVTIPSGTVVVAITAMENSTLNTTDTTAETGFGIPTGTLPKGVTIFGRFDAVTMATGSAMVYFG